MPASSALRLYAVPVMRLVIDAAKGVEPRTIRLMEVCRLRATPIITFMNKMDREIREPIELLDEIESVLKIKCAPVTWPIGMGRDFTIFALKPGEVYEVDVEVWPSCVVVPKGYRIALSVRGKDYVYGGGADPGVDGIADGRALGPGRPAFRSCPSTG